MGKPHISFRKHICWDPNNGGKPSEPTSTIVLTSSRNFYVDIRILKSSDSHDLTLPLVNGSLKHLEWAFAGSSNTLRSPLLGDPSEVVEWIHWIDSRTPVNHDSSRDVGRCFPQDNGDMLELGKMEHPESGIETDYEELWGSITVEAGESDGHAEKKIAVVMRALEIPDGDTKKATKGMVVRVGQFIQGLVVQGHHVTLERWRYTTNWRREVRLGSMELPCSHLFDPANLSKNDEVVDHGLSWHVQEKYEWT